MHEEAAELREENERLRRLLREATYELTGPSGRDLLRRIEAAIDAKGGPS